MDEKILGNVVSGMKVIWAQQELELSDRSIFLAGPTPRTNTVKSWRPEALRLLGSLDFSGIVYVPEDESGVYNDNYIGQVEWEESGLVSAKCIVFWIPRNLETMPGFTTNIEWGVWCQSGKVVLGCPEGTPKMSYLRHYANKYNIPFSFSLKQTLRNAISMLD